MRISRFAERGGGERSGGGLHGRSRARGASGAVAGAGAVTFSEHVAPIIFANCTSCHRPGEAARSRFSASRRAAAGQAIARRPRRG